MKEVYKNFLWGFLGIAFSLLCFFIGSHKFATFYLGIIFGLAFVLILAGIVDLIKKKKKSADQEKTGH